jgi:hypothetical protein
MMFIGSVVVQMCNGLYCRQEYSSKHLLALVSCVCQNNKKTRQRLTTLIEDMEIIGSR